MAFGDSARITNLDGKKKPDPKEGTTNDADGKKSVKSSGKIEITKFQYGLIGVIAIIGTIIYVKLLSGYLVDTFTFNSLENHKFFYGLLKIVSAFPVMGTLLYSIFSGLKSTWQTDHILKAIYIMLTSWIIAYCIGGVASVDFSFKKPPTTSTISMANDSVVINKAGATDFWIEPGKKMDKAIRVDSNYEYFLTRSKKEKFYVIYGDIPVEVPKDKMGSIAEYSGPFKLEAGQHPMYVTVHTVIKQKM